MQVSKWGNSLAIRLPASVVEKLQLKEGDQIEIVVRDRRHLELERKPGPRELLETIRAVKKHIPANADFHFDRDEANER